MEAVEEFTVRPFLHCGAAGLAMISAFSHWVKSPLRYSQSVLDFFLSLLLTTTQMEDILHGLTEFITATTMMLR